MPSYSYGTDQTSTLLASGPTDLVCQFATCEINSQQTKFDYTVSSLALEITTEVWDLNLQPPDDTPYDKLKEQLIKRMTA